MLAALSGGAVVLLQGAPTPSPIRFELSKIPFRLDNDQTPAKNAPEAMHGRVAVFDYNADGRPDIFFTNGGSGSDRELQRELESGIRPAMCRLAQRSFVRVQCQLDSDSFGEIRTSHRHVEHVQFYSVQLSN